MRNLPFISTAFSFFLMSSLTFHEPIFAAPDSFQIDAVHSHVGFDIKHMVITKVRGNFDSYSGSILWDDENLTHSVIEGTVETQSINTRNEKRDTHLRSGDFFKTETFPVMTFKSATIQKNNKTGDYRVTGTLTIKGVSKDISFPLLVTDTIQDGYGYIRKGFSAQLSVNRFDYDMKWNKKLDNGGLVVGEKVTIYLDIEAIKKSENKSTETKAMEKKS